MPAMTKTEKQKFLLAQIAMKQLRKFRVFVYKDGSNIIDTESELYALNMFEARRPLIDAGVPSHRIYVLDIT